MGYASYVTKENSVSVSDREYNVSSPPFTLMKDINCNWEALREQILIQWNRLTKSEIDMAGPNRSKLARLIQSKYDINASLVENYLRNFERLLPMT